MSSRIPMSIPFGWYFVGYSDELAVDEVRTLNYFNRELVMFRTSSGQVSILDAYCPHLGAHLGEGGRVEGESIRCPFHDWAFDGSGTCTDVPYAKRIPARAANGPCTKAYPAVEENGVIWAWYHPQGVAPAFDVLAYPEMNNTDWATHKRLEWHVSTHPQEISENAVDIAHFKYVHKMDAVPEGETTYDGVQRRTLAAGTRKYIDPVSGEEKTTPTRVEATQNGAGQKLARFSGLVDLVAMTLVTPVTHDRCELRLAFAHPKFPEDSFEMRVVEMTIASISGSTGIEGDIPIWNKKKFQATPILCDGDGQIMRYRKYFAQFYCDDEQAVVPS
ncbi:Rieske 2Fe-2S domain-containing protein [Haliea sp.]|jgi:3-ketosteroid 9alpha-monooxygenase subunit A|uniref:Rieske 2Fe-2S domain-containing protein n=1 Tax=Haliea sp. TaxID=1932666 RepID=UPI000C5A5640|nr:Rieske 2Fe-2S domain-containing protein [Haliea sp.]MAD63066.1 Rieske (2Fe-2S) protein [Haliea sp.]MAY91541.1 Rieske (2Fe-2S) protein [Haliea sp.]MBK40524.1 Rieske (2Fe-2S) protein [Haliea sp.]MBP68623.1 Rieske (2Fe-2S) protein [Haliea sp.]|tara:strand:- start:7291 stop:8286 length:996 start_codon:yes stop_codon:yes gene_type:complete